MNFKHRFRNYISLLKSFKKDLDVFQFPTDQIIGIAKTIKENKDSYSYAFTPLVIVIPKKFKPSHTMPKDVENISITISVKDTIEIRRMNEKKIEDPMINLDNFNIILRSKDTHFSSWHLDRHIMEKDEGDGKNLHPIYHMTYGGHFMEDMQEEDIDIYGKSLIIRAPRLMHPPLELILGIDFVFRHFIPREHLPLLDHKPYIDIVESLKKEIWFPYALALAKNYCDTVHIDNKVYGFDNYFVKRVIGHNPQDGN